MLVIFLVIGIMYMVIRNGGGFVPTLVNVMTIIGFFIQLVTTEWNDVFELCKHGTPYTFVFSLGN